MQAAPPVLVHRSQPGIRWWPAQLILVLAVLGYLALFFIPHRSEQHFNIHVAQIAIYALGALLLWGLFLSRLRWRIRWIGLGTLVGGIALLGAAFRVRGVTGNLIPILEPRWVQRNLTLPPATAGPGTLAPTAPSPALPALAGAADFPQFLGPTRDGILAGPRLATNWTALPPALLWRQPMGAAWSGFVVAGSLALTQEQRGENECTVAYDLATGRAAWAHAAPARYFNTLAGEGPRATPTIRGTRVLVQGATGLLTCLDLASGRSLWSKDILKENGGSLPEWGQASSPLVHNGLVIVSAGGRKDHSLAAYHLEDGSPAWAGGKQGATYSSPALRTLDGLPQIVLFTDALLGHDPENGQPLWKFPWPGGHPHVAMPVAEGGADLIVSSGYGTGSGRVTVRRAADGTWMAKQVWRTNRMKAKFTNLVGHGGHVYGLDDGILACLDAADGSLRWKDGKYGHGQVLLVGDLLLVMAESGEVVLVDPKPDQLRELTRFSALTAKTWNPPALAGQYLIARNDKEAACFRLPLASGPAGLPFEKRP